MNYRRTKDLTVGNVYKTFFTFGFPMVLSGVLSQAYHLIDTIIAGKMLGENALAAMGAISPFVPSYPLKNANDFAIYY